MNSRFDRDSTNFILRQSLIFKGRSALRIALAVSLICASSSIKALEVLATWNTFATITGNNPSTNSNWTSPNNYFSNLDMTFTNMIGAGPGEGGTTFSPSFDTLSGVKNGNPVTGTGSYIQLNFAKNSAFLNDSFTITGIYVQLWNNSIDTPGTSQSALHFYSTTGGFTTSTQQNQNQMNSSGTGILVDKAVSAPSSPQLYSPNQFNVIQSGVANYQIRLTPDSMDGNDPQLAFTSFSSAGGFSVPSGSVVVVVGTVAPEPGTYVLSAIAAMTLGFLVRQRKVKKVSLTI